MHSPGFPVDIVAACVPIQNYVAIGQVLLDNKQFGSIQIPADKPSTGQTLFADIVMTDPTMHTAVKAQYLNMTALRQFSVINSVPQYGQIPGGVWSCVDCSSIGPVSVPMGLDQLAASVRLVVGSAGVLYVTTALSG